MDQEKSLYELEFSQTSEWERHYSNVRTTLVVLLVTIGSGAIATSISKDGSFIIGIFGILWVWSSLGVNYIFHRSTVIARLYTIILWKYLSGKTPQPPRGFINHEWKKDEYLAICFSKEKQPEPEREPRKNIFIHERKKLMKRDKPTWFLLAWVLIVTAAWLLGWGYQMGSQ